MAAGDGSERAGPGADLLATLSDTTRDRLIAGAARVDVAAGEIVVRRGESNQSLYIVESGSLRVTVPDRHGDDLELARYGAGDFFGEMSFFTGEPISASIEAVTALATFGIDHSGSSTALTGEMIDNAELVFGMTEGHVRSARNVAGNQRDDRIVRLDPDGDIEDPIGLEQSAYDALARRFLAIIPRRLKDMLDT